MKMKNLFNGLLTALVALISSSSVFADDPVYITGAEYEVSNTTWLVVKSGEGTLVAPFDKMDGNNFSRLVVERGASLKIGVDSPFSSSRVVLYLNGTLDVNGHSFRALRLFNDPNMNIPADADDLRSVPGRIINSSETAATLTFESQSSSYFYGSIEECPGAIDITSVGNGDFVVKSPVTANAISSITATSKGVLRPETMPTMFKFVFQPPEDMTQLMKLGEIELTYRGKTVRGASSTTVTTSSKSSDSSSKNTNLIDGKANSYWTAGTTGGQTVTITINPPGPVDGYRITPDSSANRPTGWDVYVSRGTDGWKSFLVDSQRDFQGYASRAGTSTTNILFSADVRLGNVLGTNTAVTLSGSAATPMEVSTIAPMEIKSLSGSGQVLLKYDTMFGPGDMSGFTGEFCQSGNSTIPTWLKMGYLTLFARSGEEQQFSIVDGSNLSVVNGGEDLVSVLLDDTSAFADRHLFGRLADGEKGVLGLVKRGSNERIVETEDAAYTGPTAIHGGTLTVAKRRSAPYSARYIKITPTATYGTYDSGTPWGMNEFVLLDANGNRVSWPSGTSADKLGGGGNVSGGTAPGKLIDGDTTSRMLVKASSDVVYTYPPVVIDTSNGVTFVSYEWWSPHGNSADKNRTPSQWTVEISDDNEHWVVCDCGESSWTSADDAAATAGWTGANSVMRGPFAATGHAKSAGSGFYTLDSAFFGDGSSVAARDTHRKLKSRYFMFKVFETARPERDPAYSYGWELAEISLYKDGERVNWPDGTAISLAGGNVNSRNNSRLTSLVNNVVWEPDGRATADNPNAERTFIMEMPSFVVIDAGEELEFDSYAFVSTSSALANTDRIPKAWTFGIATSGESNDNYVTIDSVGSYTPGVDYTIAQAYQRLGPFDVASKYPYLDTLAANSIGDASPVAIDEGATLKIDADYEQFGPLSGAGSLDLVLNAVGEINACAPATFSGSVTGNGTLAVCGDSVQTFDDATLSGVKTLELNGGAIAGTASFGGNDVTVAFNGGATGAALSGIGTLTVTGDVKYALPDLASQSVYSATLFTATNIPAASQELLKAGELVGTASHAWLCSVTVTATSVTLDARKRGLLLLIK